MANLNSRCESKVEVWLVMMPMSEILMTSPSVVVGPKDCAVVLAPDTPVCELKFSAEPVIPSVDVRICAPVMTKCSPAPLKSLLSMMTAPSLLSKTM